MKDINPHERIRLALERLRRLAEHNGVDADGNDVSVPGYPIVIDRDEFSECISEIANAAQILTPTGD